MNIPVTRHQIDDAIAGDPGLTRVTGDFQYESVTPGTRPKDQAAAAAVMTRPRKIAAMGRVTPDRAVVYTRSGTTRLEEIWVREPDGWRLGHLKELPDVPDSRTSAAR